MEEDTQAAKTSRTIQKEETRRKIIEKAKVLFSTKSIRSVSTQEIATAAGIAKGSIFHHFANKEELVSAVMINFFDEFNEKFELFIVDLKSDPSGYKNIITYFLEDLFNYEFENPNLTKFILDFMAEYSENKDKDGPFKDMMVAIDKYMSGLLDIFKILEIKNGEVKALIFFAMLDGLSLQMDFEFGLSRDIIPELVKEILLVIEFWKQN